MTPRTAQPFHIQVWDLFLIELTNWRWSWRSMLIVGTLAPLLSTLAFGIFAKESGTEALKYILSGNAVLTLMFGLQGNVEGHFIFMRVQGTLAYFASLPVSKHALILAVVCAFFLLNLPSILVNILLGAWLLDIPLHLHPILILVIPLSALPMAGIGAWIGVRAKNPQEGNAYNLLVTFTMMAMGAVIIPPDKMPAFMLTIGKFSPATYAANAIRQAIFGPITSNMWLNLGLLFIITILIFWLVGQKLDWREN